MRHGDPHGHQQAFCIRKYWLCNPCLLVAQDFGTWLFNYTYLLRIYEKSYRNSQSKKSVLLLRFRDLPGSNQTPEIEYHKIMVDFLGTCTQMP